MPENDKLNIEQISENNVGFEVFNHVPLGICIINSNYEIIFWNVILEEWIEKNIDSVIGSKVFDIFPNLNLSVYKSRMEMIFNGGPPVIFSSQLHKDLFPSNLMDGTRRILHTIISGLTLNNMSGFYALFSFQDVTELSHRIIKYKEMRDQALDEIENRKIAEEALRQANATKDKFFSIIAHDIRNPLGIFINISDLLMNMYNELTTEEIQDFIVDINNSAKSLFNLLVNLLDWARSQTGRMEYRPEKIDLLPLANNIVSLLYINAREKNINLKIEIEPVSIVLADENMINTTIRNLVSNSIKFTNAGGEIKIKAVLIDEFYEISIIDNGIGIKEEDIGKLFRIDVHHTTIGSSNEKGTGLGLILCKEFVEKNGGKIWVESKFGEGTAFKFTIPVAK